MVPAQNFIQRHQPAPYSSITTECILSGLQIMMNIARPHSHNFGFDCTLTANSLPETYSDLLKHASYSQNSSALATGGDMDVDAAAASTSATIASDQVELHAGFREHVLPGIRAEPQDFYQFVASLTAVYGAICTADALAALLVSIADGDLVDYAAYERVAQLLVTYPTAHHAIRKHLKYNAWPLHLIGRPLRIHPGQPAQHSETSAVFATMCEHLCVAYEGEVIV